MDLPFYSSHFEARPAGQLKLFKPVYNRFVRGVSHDVVTLCFGGFIPMKTIARKATFTGAANKEVYCELRYQGQLYDAETGLYYNRHRYYDAESGQYLSPDPIGLGGGIRPQGYVHNPLEWVDPLGLAACPDLYDWYKYNRSKGMNASEAHAAIKNASPQEIFDYSLHRQGLSG
ncbi:Hypothetical protein Y17_2199 [Pectobacterium wasabiae CFBP 3304]|nr:Hypothetical protein Y17_2199 [Pectobacterium wasabiae CFBP 3304]